MRDIWSDPYLKRRFGNSRTRLKILTTITMVVFIGILVSFLGVGLIFAWFAKDLPRPDKVNRTEGLSTVILDRKGKNIYDVFEDENRIYADFANIPDTLKKATVAIEDKDFYKHKGLSTTGILRAVINIFVFRNFQGGSTLTQQLVKNALLTQERTLPRKIKEAILAIQIERKYSKDEILQMYLNEAPYGGTAVGVEAASQYYFAKPVKELNLVESVIIAGLPQSPSRYNPFEGEAKAYVARSQDVLRRMREDEYITPLQETEARSKLASVKFVSGATGLKAPHFVAYINEMLVDLLGKKVVEAGGLRVTTTLDLDLQQKAQTIVKEEVDKAKKLSVSNGAAVVLDSKTAEILVMIGSKDYLASESGGYKFNVATQGLRQPGSTLKPITYAVALKKGYTASSVLMDVDTKYPSGDPKKPEYNPKNYDSKFRGPVQLRYALANSINTIAVKVSALVGVKDILKQSYDMGITTLEPTNDNLKRIGLSMTLGGGEVTLLELTSAFGVFARSGTRIDPVAILKVEDSKGKTLYENKAKQPVNVLSSDICYIISDILSDNDARKIVFGPNSYLNIPGRTVAVKTGTTDDKRDNWTVGYTKSIVVGTWVGNNDNSAMNPSLASGITGAAPIWNRIIKEAIAKQPDEPFAKPDNVSQIEIDAYGGGIPVDGYPKRQEYFIKGTEPNSPSSIYKPLKISKRDSNKLANTVEINKGEYDTKTYVIFTEKDPVSGDGKNRWQEAIDEWASGQGEPKFHPPKETYQDGGYDQIAVSIKEPGDKSQINSNTVHVRAEAASINSVERIEISVDGSMKSSKNDSRISEDIQIDNGIHTIKVWAKDNKGNTSEREIVVGINMPYVTPTPSPSP